MTHHPIRSRQMSDEMVQAIRETRETFLTVGIVLIVVGLLAILFPPLASVAIKILVGWCLLLAGAAVLYHAFRARSVPSALWSGGIGVLHLAAGVYLAFFELTGLVLLTALLATLFAIQGGAEMMIGLRHSDRRSSSWVTFSGIASLLLGVLLLLGLPSTADWAIGLLVGLNFVTSGAAFVAIAQAARG